jgi:hypothetical protein
MKQYGARFATEFTKKQIGVIYRMAKAGDLKVEQWIMNQLYNLADFYGYDDNRSVAEEEVKVLQILDKVFANETAEAQELINEYTDWLFDHISAKRQAQVNRNLVA